MSRDRSRPERTSEERERDRLERERRRAGRSAAPQPDPADPLPFEEAAHPDALDPVEPAPPVEPPAGEPPAHESPVFEPEPAAYEPPLSEAPADEPVAYEPPVGEAPLDQPVAYEPPVGEAPLDQPVAYEPPVDEPVAYEPPVAEAPADEPVAYEPPVHEPAAHEAPMSERPEPEPEPAQPSAGQLSPEPLGEEAPVAEPAAAERSPHEQPAAEAAAAEADPQATQSYEVPGLPPEDPAPPPRQGLPEPPPRLRAARERRGLRRGPAAGAGALGRPPVGARRRSAPRGVGSRLAALVALLVAAGALVLLVHSLKGSSHAKLPPATAVVKVLIPEGKTRVQIAQIAQAAGLKGSYRAAAKRSDLLNPVRYGAPHGTPDLEGFLFPATYDMDRGGPASRLVEEQLTAFQENFGPEDVGRAKALGVTPYQLLTVASMIEREAQVPGDRAKIAAVIYNRLKAGMPLGIDASIYYAVEMEKNIATYTHELTEAQLQINSPYNTRTHTGLPPTPISNPGTASIQAAAHPAHVSYLYYVAAADGCGEQVFSDTQSAFEANVAAYEAAKRQNGGHPPACKHK